MRECRRPSTSLVVRWEETGSKGHLALRKGSLVILANKIHWVISTNNDSSWQLFWPSG